MNDKAPETRTLISERLPGRSVTLQEGLLKVTEGRDAGREFRFTSQVCIGSADDNDIVLSDDTISRHHAQIEETEGGFLLKDLGSRNGTFIDHVKVLQAYLPPGGQLRLGTTLLRFTLPGERIPIERSTRRSFGGIIGSSPALRDTFGLLERVAPSDLNVLVIGETGTGKEVVSRSVHDESLRRSGPYVVFDCSAVSQDLMESALFGHREGAFTGASASRKGAFPSAHKGTLFLDEIGELPMDLQPKLLRVLETREIQPLGSDQRQLVDVRIVAATNRDLRRMVEEKKFRQDLFYRLSVVEVFLPPLRERRDDIPLLVDHLVKLAGAEGHPITAAALARLESYSWPGNVRELRNIVQRGVVLAGEQPIDVEHLSFPKDAVAPPSRGTGLSGDDSLNQVEALAIQATLEKTDWNKTKAARILGISRQTLIDKIERYQLKRE